MATISPTLLSTPTPTYATSAAGTLGKDDFLKLLVKQLQNQDPMNPLDSSQFATQLAQFSSVEQLANINSNLEASISTNQLMAQSIGNSMASSMIGRDVKASGNTLQWNGSDDVRFGYTLAAQGLKSKVTISDSNGETVQVIDGTGVDAGDTNVTWNGKNINGQEMPAGKYTFKVEVTDAQDKDVTSSPFVLGSITGVRFTASGTVFLVDGAEIPVANILEILNGASHG
jgi:flagellar basal-body rod modification protein FlgD